MANVTKTCAVSTNLSIHLPKKMAAVLGIEPGDKVNVSVNEDGSAFTVTLSSKGNGLARGQGKAKAASASVEA